MSMKRKHSPSPNTTERKSMEPLAPNHSSSYYLNMKMRYRYNLMDQVIASKFEDWVTNTYVEFDYHTAIERNWMPAQVADFKMNDRTNRVDTFYIKFVEHIKPLAVPRVIAYEHYPAIVFRFYDKNPLFMRVTFEGEHDDAIQDPGFNNP